MNIKQALRLFSIFVFTLFLAGAGAGSASAALTFTTTDISSDGAFTLTFEGVTADPFENTISSNDPTADNSFILGAAGDFLITGAPAADPVTAFRASYGGTGIVFEGATADASELTLTAADAGADATVTIPATTGNVLLTTSGTTSILTSSTGATFTFGPATDDQLVVDPVAAGAGSFAGTITSADLTAARTWTFPDATGTVQLSGNALSGTSINLGGTTLLDVLNAVTAAIDLASAAANTCVTGTSTAVTQTIALGDTVIVSPSADDAAWDIGSLTAFVEAAGTPGTIKIVYCNNSAVASDPASMTYELTVLQF